jgi:Tol biopolymer transport system component
VVVFGAVLSLAAYAAGLLTAGWIARPEPFTDIRVHRLTDVAGLEEYPAISPDGKSVAFVADVGTSRQLFVRLLAGGAALQVTRDARSPQYPRWSRDSASLLYYAPPAEGELQGSIWEVSALGGAPRRIVSAVSAGDISRDGKQLAFFQVDGQAVRLMFSTRDGANLRSVVQLDGAWRYLTPRWSPNDQWIAYQRISVNTHGAFIVPATGGEPRHVVRDTGLLSGLAWLPDASGLIFSASRGATVLYLPTFNLWTVRRTGDGLRQITFGEASYLHPDLNAAGTVVASRLHMQFDIWRYPTAADPIENTRQAVRVTHQTGQVQTPSPDSSGDQIVYLSDTGGHGNLWVTRISSGESRQITFERDPATVVGVPIWSPAGDQIAFYTTSNWAIGYYSLIRPDGSNLRRLIPEGGWGAWSHDGRWFYYAAQVKEGIGEDLRLNKIDVRDGTVVLVRGDNVASPAPAPDGRTLYFFTQLPAVAGQSDVEIRVASPEDAPSRVLTRISSHRLPAWQRLTFVVSSDGKWLAFPLTDGATTNIWTISTSDGSFRQVTDLGQRPTFIVRRVSWSPDGQSIFAAVGEGDADIVLLAGLRP